MDRNLILAFGLSFAVLMLWSALVEPSKKAVPEGNGASPGVVSTESPANPGEPMTEPSEPVAALPSEVPAAPPPAVAGQQAERLSVSTEYFEAELDSRGASLALWKLHKFDTGPKHGDRPVVLTTGDAPFASALLTPLVELGLGDLSGAVFAVEEAGQNRFRFRYTRNGVNVHKDYTFSDDGYGFELRLSVENGSENAIQPRFGVAWPAATRPGVDFKEQAVAVMHEGSVETQMLEAFGKPGFFGGGERELLFSREVDWAGMQTPYFVAAIAPDDPSAASAQLAAVEPGRMGIATVAFDPVELGPGQSAERVFRIYIGPKEPDLLDAFGAGLDGSIDLGWSWMVPLTRFFSWLLQALYGIVGNYGVAIIVLTILVRVVTAPLTNKQMGSMERMRGLAPKLAELKEKYADDRQKQSEEMMRLYRQEGVNPLGGCFPMLLQLPVFIGLFYALRSSISLRQAPFFGWIDDLSAPEQLFMLPGIDVPVRVLPLLMGGTMVLQQRVTPMQQMDPAQQRMMTIMMPVVMTVVFYQFASGLVLYWMVSNVLAVSHQLWIGRGLRKKQPASTPQVEILEPEDGQGQNRVKSSMSNAKTPRQKSGKRQRKGEK